MPSLVVIGQQIKEKRRRAQCVPPAYMVPKYPSLNRVKLTLPVRRYLVPTPSTKGGGLGEATPYPHNFGNCKLYNLKLWQAIRTIYERQKTGGVGDLSLVRFPWQLFYLRVFLTKFC